MQSMGRVEPVPRGSKLTMSNRSRISAGKVVMARGSVSVPESPGPPKFTTSVPMRSFGTRARTRMSATSTVSPSGAE
jgi:hypothetical protein